MKTFKALLVMVIAINVLFVMQSNRSIGQTGQNEILDKIDKTIVLPSPGTGVIPEDIIYIEAYSRFYVYGNNKLLIVEYDNQNSNYIVTGNICLSVSNETPNDCLRYGNNYFPKDDETFNNAKNKYLAYDEEHNILYVLRPDFHIVSIDVNNNVLNQEEIFPFPPIFEPSSYDKSKIFFHNHQLFFLQKGYWNSEVKQYFGVFDADNSYTPIVNYYFSSPNMVINDFIPDEYNNVYILYNQGTGFKIQMRPISSSFNIPTAEVSIQIENPYFFLAANNRIYIYGNKGGDGEVYVIDPTSQDLSYSLITHYGDENLPPIFCVTYDDINNLIYFGTSQIGTPFDTFVYNYNEFTGEHTFLSSLSTNSVFPPDPQNKPYYLYFSNGFVLASKRSEIVKIEYNGGDSFKSSRLVQKLNNFFYIAEQDKLLNNVLVLNLEGVIHVIDSNGDYIENSDIQVGIKVTDACHIPFTNIVCFYTRDRFQDNHIIIYNNETNEIIEDIKSELPVSDLIYNPFLSEIVVSYYANINYFTSYNFSTPIQAQIHNFDNQNTYCGKMFIDPNGKLYCAVGLNDIATSRILILDALNDYSQYFSLNLQNSPSSLSDFKVSFTYHEPNSKVYATVMQKKYEINYSDIVEINPNNGSLIHLNSNYLYNLPMKIESCPLHNKLYVQYLTAPHITRITYDQDGQFDYYDIPNLENSNILDIEYDKYRDFLYFTTQNQKTGFVYCDLDIFAHDRIYYTHSWNYPILYNNKNRMCYFYCPEDTQFPLNNMLSSEPLDWQGTESISLNNTIRRMYSVSGMNTFTLDDYQNLLYIPNGSQCNFNVVKCKPERRYIGINIPNPNNLNYVCFPSISRNEGVSPEYGIPARELLENYYIPFEPDYSDLYLVGKDPNNNNAEQTISYDHQHGWVEDPENWVVYSSRGYGFRRNFVEGKAFIQMEGLRLNPGWDLLPLIQDQEGNWTGYFIDETQHVFNALGQVRDNLYLIQSQLWSCAPKFWSSDPLESVEWICDGYDPEMEIPIGFVSYGTMVILYSNIEGTFAWTSNQDPYPERKKSAPVHYSFDNSSIYTPIFVEIDTASRPLEIAAFIGDSCIGATTVAIDDTIVMIPAFNNGDTTSLIELEEYYGNLKVNATQRIKEYKSFNSNIERIVEQPINIRRPKNGAYFISLKGEDLLEQSTTEGFFKCYPNPYSSGILSFAVNLDQSSNLTFEVYDNVGRLMQFVDLGFKPMGQQEIVIDDKSILQSFRSGCYHIFLKSDYQLFQSKLVVY